MPHLHDKIDFTAEVFVVYKNKVLLRKHDKYKIWLGVGGHIELDEDPNQAAVREVKEEVGLNITLAGQVPTFRNQSDYKELIPPQSLNRHKINDTHEHIAMVYFASAENDNITQNQEEISDNIHWFTAEELDDESYGILESVRYSAQQALEELGKVA